LTGLPLTKREEGFTREQMHAIDKTTAAAKLGYSPAKFEFVPILSTPIKAVGQEMERQAVFMFRESPE